MSRLDVCESKVEVTTPFWASNSNGKVMIMMMMIMMMMMAPTVRVGCGSLVSEVWWPPVCVCGAAEEK